MLLRNESRIRHSILIKLVFDDDTCRELEVQEGDYISVSYRKNGYVRCGVGVIKNIKPYFFTKKWRCKSESAVITVDMSSDLQCNIDSFDLFDIIDIKRIIPVDCQCCCCNVGNEIQQPNIPQEPTESQEPEEESPIPDEEENKGSEVSE